MKLLITYAVSAGYGIAHYAYAKASALGISFKLSTLCLYGRFCSFKYGLSIPGEVYAEFAGRHGICFGN
jgi:hypothetical protein